MVNIESIAARVTRGQPGGWDRAPVLPVETQSLLDHLISVPAPSHMVRAGDSWCVIPLASGLGYGALTVN